MTFDKIAKVFLLKIHAMNDKKAVLRYTSDVFNELFLKGQTCKHVTFELPSEPEPVQQPINKTSKTKLH